MPFLSERLINEIYYMGPTNVGIHEQDGGIFEQTCACVDVRYKYTTRHSMSLCLSRSGIILDSKNN